jgi:hypothetical protein
MGRLCGKLGCMSRLAPIIVATPEERHTLEALEVSRTAPVREVQRARIILLAALSINLLGGWLRDRLDPKLRNL